MPSEMETRCAEAWNALMEALSGVEAEEAEAFRLPAWPQHEYSAGEDGSISGIVRHVAAWKGAYADGLETGNWGDEKAGQPDTDSWEARLAWLACEHERLVSAMRRLEAAESASLLIDDRPYITDSLFDEMIRHDSYHAAQVNYLRQRYAAQQGSAA